MAWSPISLFVPQFEATTGLPASGYVLKAYEAGTSTNTPFATDSTGATQVTSIALNADGYPSVSGNIVIPHIDQTFKLALYPTQAAADANSGAKWTIDNLTPVENVSFGNSVNSQTTNYTVLTADKGKLIYYSGAGGVTLGLPAAATAGDGFSFLVENDTTGNVTIDPDGAEQINGTPTFVLDPGQSCIVIGSGSSWRSLDWSSLSANNIFSGDNDVKDTLEIYDPSDTTKKVRIDAGAVATGATRVITMGDADFTLAAATQAQQETGTSNTVIVTPGRQHFNSSASKAWAKANNSGSLVSAYNITAVVDDGAGLITFTIGTDFSSADYVISTGIKQSSPTEGYMAVVSAQAAGSISLEVRDHDGVVNDVDNFMVSCFGDHA